jgi:hypothetical protein
VPNTFQFVGQYMGLECLRILVNELEVSRHFNTDMNKDFTKPFAIGETTLVKLPQRFTIRDGLSFTDQGINRRAVPVTMQAPFGIDFAWDSVEAALKAERSETEIRDQYLQPAMAQLAQEIDSRCTKFAYLNTNNIAGVLGTTPSAMSTYSRARTILQENACPTGNNEDRCMIITPAMSEAAVTANAAVFNPPTEIAREFREGTIGTYAGSTWYESMSLYDHVPGTAGTAGTITVTGAGQSGTQLKITNTSVGETFNVGDVFGLDYGLATQVNNVNPSTRRSTGRVKYFTVTAPLTCTAGPDTLNIAAGPYGIAGPGDQYQNVSALPGNGAVLTPFPGTATPWTKHGVNGLNFTRDAFALVSSNLEMPKAVEPLSFMKRDPKTGIAIRFVSAWDQNLSRITHRFDVMIGLGALYSDNASVRILSLQ